MNPQPYFRVLDRPVAQIVERVHPGYYAGGHLANPLEEAGIPMASLLNDGLNFSGAVGVYVGTVLTGVLLYWAQHRRRNSVNRNGNVTRREWAFGKSSRSRGLR